MLTARRILLHIGVMLISLAGVGAPTFAETADLLTALHEGSIWAEFHGTGELGVDATIGRNTGGPNFVAIPPGTQFWAQASGRQGQTTLGWVPIDLSRNAVASLRIPTACTNINRRAPTPDDQLFPEPCPDDRMARLCGVGDPARDDLNAIQLAVWAVANNPSLRTIGRHEDDLVPAEVTEPELRRRELQKLLDTAAALLEKADLRPTSFRMFR